MIGVLGTSHRCADLATREVIAKALSAYDTKAQQGSVCLLTCNRAEWYFCTHTPSKTHQEMISFLRDFAGTDVLCHLYTFFGLECVRHLGKVVSGFDSVFIGETEIQGQVKAAYDAARAAHPLPKELHFLFQRALHTGKVVRAQMALPEYQGLCDQVSRLVSEHMEQVPDPSVLLIGTSMMNTKLAKALTCAKVTIVNRTNEKAHLLASEIGGKAIEWDELPRLWCQYPCVIAATRSAEYLLRPSDPLPPLHMPQLLIDLGVPRNIDPALSSTRKIVDIEAFTPAAEVETILTVLSDRLWKDLERKSLLHPIR